MELEQKEQFRKLVHDLRSRLSTASLSSHLIKVHAIHPKVMECNERTMNALFQIDDLVHQLSDIVDAVPVTPKVETVPKQDPE